MRAILHSSGSSAFMSSLITGSFSVFFAVWPLLGAWLLGAVSFWPDEPAAFDLGLVFFLLGRLLGPSFFTAPVSVLFPLLSAAFCPLSELSADSSVLASSFVSVSIITFLFNWSIFPSRLPTNLFIFCWLSHYRSVVFFAAMNFYCQAAAVFHILQDFRCTFLCRAECRGNLRSCARTPQEHFTYFVFNVSGR